MDLLGRALREGDLEVLWEAVEDTHLQLNDRTRAATESAVGTLERILTALPYLPGRGIDPGLVAEIAGEVHGLDGFARTQLDRIGTVERDSRDQLETLIVAAGRLVAAQPHLELGDAPVRRMVCARPSVVHLAAAMSQTAGEDSEGMDAVAVRIAAGAMATYVASGSTFGSAYGEVLAALTRADPDTARDVEARLTDWVRKVTENPTPTRTIPLPSGLQAKLFKQPRQQLTELGVGVLEAFAMERHALDEAVADVSVSDTFAAVEVARLRQLEQIVVDRQVDVPDVEGAGWLIDAYLDQVEQAAEGAAVIAGALPQWWERSGARS